MKHETDITVIITTYNNASQLKRTLEGLTHADRTGLDVECVIVNNNSSDDTQSVIDSFAPRLPIQSLHEPRKGKCAALNRALNTISLGRLVFFTDDDVDVSADLFHEIAACSSRNTHNSVFGGLVQLVWPPGDLPKWALVLSRSYKGYSHLNLGTEERAFPPRLAPVGTNWWARREVLQRGYRFDERIGPGAKRCCMGDETAFLLRLVQEGFPIIYAPRVRIGHRVPGRLLVEKEILRRGLTFGKVGAILAYEYGFGPKRYIRSDQGWRLLRSACLLRYALSYAAASLSPGKTRRMIRRWDAMKGIGWNIEALRIASGTYRACDAASSPIQTVPSR